MRVIELIVGFVPVTFSVIFAYLQIMRKLEAHILSLPMKVSKALLYILLGLNAGTNCHKI